LRISNAPATRYVFGPPLLCLAAVFHALPHHPPVTRLQLQHLTVTDAQQQPITTTPPPPLLSAATILAAATMSSPVTLGDLATRRVQVMRSMVADNSALATAITKLSADLSHISRVMVTVDGAKAIAHTSSLQVIVALATLQSSVQDLSRAYIQHANTVLAPGRGGVGTLDSNLTNILSESGLLTGRSADVIPAAQEAEAEGKKKRKRTPHDPNAPKRALTPYFLYMQSARSQIARELGDQAKPKEVADEGTRRWTQMSPAEKSASLPSFSPHSRPTDRL